MYSITYGFVVGKKLKSQQLMTKTKLHDYLHDFTAFRGMIIIFWEIQNSKLTVSTIFIFNIYNEEKATHFAL